VHHQPWPETVEKKIHIYFFILKVQEKGERTNKSEKILKEITANNLTSLKDTKGRLKVLRTHKQNRHKRMPHALRHIRIKLFTKD
jgi:hypothetical protein